MSGLVVNTEGLIELLWELPADESLQAVHQPTKDSPRIPIEARHEAHLGYRRICLSTGVPITWEVHSDKLGSVVRSIYPGGDIQRLCLERGPMAAIGRMVEHALEVTGHFMED